MQYLLFLLICSTAVSGPIDRIGWLQGSWAGGTPGKQMLETWRRQNDSTYAGKSVLIKGADTLLLETVSLEQRGGQLYYVPTVNGQNEGKPVRFTLTHITDRRLVFENPAHDFPQKVSYTLIHADSLLAEISGTVQGQIKTRQFPMKRQR